MCTLTVKIYQQFETPRVAAACSVPIRAATRLCLCERLTGSSPGGCRRRLVCSNSRGAPFISAASPDQINRLTASRKCRFIISGRVSAPFPTQPQVLKEPVKGAVCLPCYLSSSPSQLRAHTLSFQLWWLNNVPTFVRLPAWFNCESQQSDCVQYWCDALHAFMESKINELSAMRKRLNVMYVHMLCVCVCVSVCAWFIDGRRPVSCCSACKLTPQAVRVSELRAQQRTSWFRRRGWQQLL